MKKAVHTWVQVDDLIVSYSTAGVITSDLWNEFMRDMRTKQYTRFLGGVVGALEVNSVQRKEASGLFKQRKIRLGVLTDDSLVRGIITAASWLGVDTKAFPWSDVRAAMGYLRVSEPMTDLAIGKLDELKRIRAK